MEIPDIVVNGGLVVGASVVLAFVLNQGYTLLAGYLAKWTGGRIQLPALGEFGKKAVVAGVSLSLAGYSGLAIVPAGSPPELLLAYGTAVFKASQQLYDRLWVALLKAK